MARHRILGFAIGFATLLAGTAQPASAGGGCHPLFNDQGTIPWYSSLDEAQAVARATGKLIFVESGRRACGNCRHMVERVLPVQGVRARVSAISIGLADDCDEPDSRLTSLFNAGIPNATTLPLCGFLTPELRWVTGFSGYMDAGSFSGHLTLAEERFQRIKAYRRPVAPPPPCATPAPAPAPRPAPPCAPAPPTLDLGDCPGGVCHLPPARPKSPPPVAAPPTPVRPLATGPAPAPSNPAPAPRVLPLPVPERSVAVAPSPAPSSAGPAVLAPVPSPESPSATGAPAIAAPRVVAIAPPAPTHPAVVVPTASPMTRARRAAAEGRWGAVLKVGDEPIRLQTTEKAEFDALVRRANEWVLGSLEAVVTAAKAGDFSQSRRTLAVLAKQLEGTTCPSLIDAERGLRAVDRLSAMEQGSPDQADAPDTIRKKAYAEFRGTRWAPLFKGRVAGR